MVQSLELVLDTATDDAVRTEWRALSAAGLPSLADHTGESNRPHVTLSVAATVPAEVEERTPEALAGLPLPVLVGPLVVLGGRRLVLARLVVPTVRLLELHARVATVWAAAVGVVPTAEPGRWVPHVTLATGLDVEQLGRAIEVLRGVGGTDTVTAAGEATVATAVGVRRWDGEARRTWGVSAGA